MLRRRLYAAAPRYGVSISLFLLLVIYFICFLCKIMRPSGRPSQCRGSMIQLPRRVARGCTASSVVSCAPAVSAWMATVAGLTRTSTIWPADTRRAGVEYRLAANDTRQSLPTRRRCRSATTYGVAGSGRSAAWSRWARTPMTSPWVRWVWPRLIATHPANAASSSASEPKHRPART